MLSSISYSLYKFQDELERLNVSANSINHLEAELDVSVVFFHPLFSFTGYEWLISLFIFVN